MHSEPRTATTRTVIIILFSFSATTGRQIPCEQTNSVKTINLAAAARGRLAYARAPRTWPQVGNKSAALSASLRFAVPSRSSIAEAGCVWTAAAGPTCWSLSERPRSSGTSPAARSPALRFRCRIFPTCCLRTRAFEINVTRRRSRRKCYVAIIPLFCQTDVVIIGRRKTSVRFSVGKCRRNYWTSGSCNRKHHIWSNYRVLVVKHTRSKRNTVEFI